MTRPARKRPGTARGRVPLGHRRNGVEDRPMAARGLKSYRYRGPYGWIMIGAKDDRDALKEASRSTREKTSYEHLEVWHGDQYVPVQGHRRNGAVEQLAADAPIANPGTIADFAEERAGTTTVQTGLWLFSFGAYGSTNVFVWADSIESAFEEAVEWLDDNAPGHLVSLDEAELREAAEDLGIDWQPEWPNDDPEFQRVQEHAEADLTVIGHTSLKHGQYVLSHEWHVDEVDPSVAPWDEVAARSWAEGYPDIEVDYDREGPDEKEPTSGLRVQTTHRGDVEITEWTDVYDATGEPESEGDILRQDAVVPLDKLLDPKGKHRGTYGGRPGIKTLSVEDVLRLPPSAREPVIVDAAISYLVYFGGEESHVDYIGG